MSNSALIEQAKAKVNQNDFDAALLLLNKIISQDTSHEEAIYERGVLYSNLKKMELALFDFNKLIELYPNNPFYYSCRGFIKSGLKDSSGAIQDYEYAIKLDPNDAITYNNLGLLQEQAGFNQMAQKSFHKSNEQLGYNPNRYGEGKIIEPATLTQSETQDIKKTTSKSEVLKSVFTNKSIFREFINFIKNGFKIKEDDQN